MKLKFFALALVAFAAVVGANPDPEVFYQAHRGGLAEVPENTMAAFRHAWSCPGAVPEVDIRTTRDNVFVCLHDETPSRTTNAPPDFEHKKISAIDCDTVRQWDAGSWFAPKFAGEKVPLLTEVFEEIKGRPKRLIYLDAKHVDLDLLAALVCEYGLNEQVIFTHEDPELGQAFKEKVAGAQSMTWLSGPPVLIKSRFRKLAEKKFGGVDQLQLHLKAARTTPEIVYALDEEFLHQAIEKTRGAGVQLQLRPFQFDPQSLRPLIDAGVRWFVTDEPRRFSEALAKALAAPGP